MNVQMSNSAPNSLLTNANAKLNAMMANDDSKMN